MDEENSNLSSGLSEDEAEDSAVGALPFGVEELQKKYGQALSAYERSNQKVLDEITKARDLLLSQPTEKSKKQYIRGLASALTAPRERTDPRFYERRNLFTLLRDIGEYGSAEEQAAKEAKLAQQQQKAKFDELLAKYEQQAAAQQLRELGPLYRETIKPKREAEIPADARSIRYYRSVLRNPTASEEDKKDAEAMLTKLTRIPSEEAAKPTWNERVLQAKLRKRQGKATQEDEVIIEMSEKAGGDFLSILRILSGNQE